MRTGTTYALLSLASLSDVAGDYEIVFFPEFPLSSHHICIPNGMSARPIINAISEDEPVVGSKLTLGHDYRYMRDAGVLSNFIRCFEGVKVVHVVRPYFEQLVSRTGRFEHRVDERLADTQLISQETAKSAAHLQRQRSEIMTFQECTAALVSCLFGDALIHAIGRHTDYLLVPYDAISAELPAMARFIGSRASPDEIERIAQAPPIKPTRRGREDLLDDPEKLRGLCAGFDQKAAGFLGTAKPFEEIFRIDGNNLEFL